MEMLSNECKWAIPLLKKIDILAVGSFDAPADAMYAACEEFYEGIPSAADKKRGLTPKALLENATPPADADSVAWDLVEFDTLDEFEGLPPGEEPGVKDKIIALAWEARFSGDASRLESYLKEQNLYHKFKRISEKYNIEQHQKNLCMRPKSIPAKNFRKDKWKYGDIFLKHDVSSSGSPKGPMGWAIPGHWKHAAYFDKERLQKKNKQYFLLSASNKTDASKKGKGNKLGAVGHDELKNYWTRSKDVAVCRVKGAGKRNRRKAIEYGRKWIGKPFSILPYIRRNNTGWYCSKVVYRGWKSRGYDLDSPSNLYKYASGIKWKKKKIGFGIKVSYPVVTYTWMKDSHVTPTNLKHDNNTKTIARW